MPEPSFPRYRRFNKRLAIRVTRIVGSMTFAYFCVLLTLCSLPAVLSAFPRFRHTFPNWATDPSIIAFVAWIAQTFLQLVLLGIIIVGQRVASDASEARTEASLGRIADALDLDTEGGIHDLEARILAELRGSRDSMT